MQIDVSLARDATSPYAAAFVLFIFGRDDSTQIYAAQVVNSLTVKQPYDRIVGSGIITRTHDSVR